MKAKNVTSGQPLPALGFGTGDLTPDGAAKKVVSEAIRLGYRLIDTAKIYDNEAGVGAAIRQSGIDRKHLFVVTKLWNDDQGYESAIAGCQASLERLGLEYVDLYLIHWPITCRRVQSWRALQELQRQGRTRAIGVSNYTVRHLEELMANGERLPDVNQVEFHPFIYEQQKELLIYCREHNIIVQAYSPLARIAREVHPTIQAVARRISRSPSQVVLRWCIQHGTVPLSRSRRSEHIQENLRVFDFELDDEVMMALNSLSDGERVTWDPAVMG